MRLVDISIIVPVYNEEDSLSLLFRRLVDTLDGLGRSYEIVFTNDGSRDKSLALLQEFQRKRPYVVSVIDFNGNYGQHVAIMAAFERACGRMAVTLDADLQNPPEEIPKLIAKIDEGYDLVGGIRAKRRDSRGRRVCSFLMNRLRERITGMKMTDQGCMLRAYDRKVYQAVARSEERALFIPALAHTFASNPTEMEIDHSERSIGESSYNYYKLIRLNFDLVTGFSLVPLQIFTLFGFATSALSGLLVVYMAGRRIFLGPEAEGVFTLLAILLFLVSVGIAGIGIVGEYVGRAFQAAQNRPRYIVRSEMLARAALPRVLFFGYSQMGYLALRKLLEEKVKVVGVFTHEDDPSENIWFQSVEDLARSNNISVYKPGSLRGKDWVRRVQELEPDLILSFYYRLLIPPLILNLAPLGAFNMHGSYLPRYRGKAPVNWAVLNGEEMTGATLHVMVKQPDAGNIVDREAVSIGPAETAFEVMEKVQDAALRILGRQLDALLSGATRQSSQDDAEATYCRGRRPEDGRIDWRWTSQRIHNLVRAVAKPYPGAFHDTAEDRLVIWRTRLPDPQPELSLLPGTVTHLDPLTLSTIDGQLEVLDFEWRARNSTGSQSSVAELKIGDQLVQTEAFVATS